MIVIDVSWGDCVDNGSIVTCAHGTAGRAPNGYTRWRSIWHVKQILNYQMRSAVSQNAIICIRLIKNICNNYHVSISVVDENINEDVSAKQNTCSLLDCSYFPVHWFIESGVHVDTVHVISEVDSRLATGLHPMKSSFTLIKDDSA